MECLEGSDTPYFEHVLTEIFSQSGLTVIFKRVVTLRATLNCVHGIHGARGVRPGQRGNNSSRARSGGIEHEWWIRSLPRAVYSYIDNDVTSATYLVSATRLWWGSVQ